MNDVISSSELFGKVVVVTEWEAIPTSCLTCAYCYYDKRFCKATLLEFEDARWKDRRPDFCPLSLVGR